MPTLFVEIFQIAHSGSGSVGSVRGSRDNLAQGFRADIPGGEDPRRAGLAVLACYNIAILVRIGYMRQSLRVGQRPLAKGLQLP